jgi:hypothetical protein
MTFATKTAKEAHQVGSNLAKQRYHENKMMTSPMRAGAVT